jgi:hypothetical protein
MRDDIHLARTPPHSLEAEQALLGAILVNNTAYERVSGFLEGQHFFDPLHQQVYEIAGKLIAEGRLATPITLRPHFENAEPVGDVPVPAYLGKLAVEATTIANARDYGRTIRDLAMRRQLILIGEDIAKAAFEANIDFPPKQQIEEAETRLYALARSGGSDTPELRAPRDPGFSAPPHRRGIPQPRQAARRHDWAHRPRPPDWRPPPWPPHHPGRSAVHGEVGSGREHADRLPGAGDVPVDGDDRRRGGAA